MGLAKCRGVNRQGKMPRLIDAFCTGAPIQTELQVLGGVVGLSQLFRDPHCHYTDVAGVQLHVVARVTMNGVSTAHSAIIKSSREVVCDGLVDPLVCAALEWFEDDGDLWTDRQRRVLDQ
uniref:Uncharacterized protein n=1 Tax=Cynoglossus semilaevis TaxID=244447 RepID=A0A3P8WIC4_CYNSE